MDEKLVPVLQRYNPKFQAQTTIDSFFRPLPNPLTSSAPVASLAEKNDKSKHDGSEESNNTTKSSTVNGKQSNKVTHNSKHSSLEDNEEIPLKKKQKNT